MKQSHDYKYYSYDKENSILVHNITPENSYSESSYVTSISHFTTLIEKLRPKNIIVRVLTQPSNYDEKLKYFTKSVIRKTIIDVGVRRIAFYFSNESFISLIKHKEYEGEFQTRIFFDFEKAQEWVMEKYN